MKPAAKLSSPSLRRYLALIATIWALCGPVGATYYDPEYLIDSWQTEQGLPENSANALVQTPDGYLWIATFNGLVRFDGMKFTVFNRANTPELPSDGIVNLHLDQSGRMWVSTLKGIAVRQDNKWNVLKKSQVSPSNFIRTFSEAAGVLCFTTYDGKVFRAEDGHPVELPSPPGFPAQGYFGHVDRAGTIWVCQDHFFGHWDGRQWLTSPLDQVITNKLRGVGTGRDGSLLAVSGKTLRRINDGKITAESVLDKDPNVLWRIYEDSGGSIWLCTQENGLYRVPPTGAIKHFSTTNGLIETGIRFAFEDREKNIWVGSSGGGLTRIKRRTFEQVDTSKLLPTLTMTALVEESPGRILFGSYGAGVGRMANGRMDRIDPIKGDPAPRYVQSLLVDRAGSLWIGTYHQGASVLDKTGELRNLAATDTGGIDAAALFEDSQQRIWIAGDETISLFADGHFTVFSNSAGLSLGGVKCFAEDTTSGTIWAGSTEGLFRFEAGRWSEFKDNAGRSLDETTCLHADADGTIWIGGSTVTLRRLRAGLLTVIAEAQGLPVQILTAIIDDGLGYFWFGSNRGVVRVARKELEKATGGAKGPLTSQLFNLGDGLPSVECVGGFQSTALKDSDGRLLFATGKGVVRVDPRTLKLNTNPPPVLVEEFRVENRASEQTYVPVSGLNPIIVPPGQREIKVGFSALSFTAPEKVRFAYKLEGIHNDWVDIGNRSSLYFYPPPPGDYLLQVKAANNDGLWNETGAAIAFVVQPFVWQTLWFRALALAGLLGGTGCTVWLIGLAKTNRKIERLEQERALERERAQLASVMETTSDFVGFSTPDGQVLFINRAGRRMLGIGETEDVRSIKVADHYPGWADKLVVESGLPTAIREGTWSGDLALKHRDGHEIPVSQVIVSHRAPDGRLDFISTIARDISGQQKAVMALRESEERFRHLTQAAFEVVCISENGTLIDINDQGLKIFGYTRDEMIGKAIVEMVAPESRAKVAEAIRIGSEGMNEHLMLRKDGSTFYGEAQAKMTRVGHRTFRMTALRDVSDRKRAEQQKMLLAAIVEFSDDAIIGESSDGTITSWNRGAERIFGFAAEEAVGRRVQTLLRPDQQQEADILARMARGETMEHLESGCIREDGKRIEVSATISPLKDAAGKVTGASRIARDITETKRMENLANGQRRILEMIASDAPLKETLDALLRIIETQVTEMFCSVLLLDANGARLWHCSAPRLPASYTKAIDGEAIGPSVGSCGTAAFRRKAVFVENIATDPLWEKYKTVALAHNLRACWSTPIFDAQQNILGTFAIYHQQTGLPKAEDVELIDLATHTAAIAISRQRAKAALQETEGQLRQMQKMEGIGQLAGGVAHDFNNILTSLMMQTELSEMVENLPPEARDGLRQIRADAQRAAELTRQLLLFSRRQVMQVRLLNLNEMVVNLSRMLHRIIGEDVELELHLHPGPLMVRADAGMIDQVLMNLAINARDAMPEGGRLLIKTALATVDKDGKDVTPESSPGQYVCISVADTGKGIPPEILPQIFEPFFTTKDVGKGTGLGLATVFGIVKQHQGWIKVDNRPEQGATFHVYLPV